MDSEPLEPNAFFCSPISRYLNELLRPCPHSFRQPAPTSPTSVLAAATSPTFLPALANLQRRRVRRLHTASENVLTEVESTPAAKKARQFAPPRSSKEVKQARKETIPKKSLIDSIGRSGGATG